MKKLKIFTLIASVGLCAGALFGCNKELFDTTYGYNKAIVSIGDNAIPMVLDIKKWNDYEGEQLQLTLTDDSIILTSSFNTILVSDENSIIFKEENVEGKRGFYSYRNSLTAQDTKAEK